MVGIPLLFVVAVFGLFAGIDRRVEMGAWAAFGLIGALMCLLGRSQVRRPMFMLAMLLLMFTILVAGLRGFYAVLLRWLAQPNFQGVFVIVLVSTIILVVGLTLFYIRLRFRFCYGLSELCAGVAVAGYKVSSEIHRISEISVGWSLAILTAGIYLVVRGLDNMHQGVTKEPLDAIVIWLAQYIPLTTRYETRLQFERLRRHGATGVLREGRFYGRRTLQQKIDSQIRINSTGHSRSEDRLIHIVAIDDDALVFRLPAENLGRPLAKGVSAWGALSATGARDEWIVVPHKVRELWPEYFRLALENSTPNLLH